MNDMLKHVEPPHNPQCTLFVFALVLFEHMVNDENSPKICQRRGQAIAELLCILGIEGDENDMK